MEERLVVSLNGEPVCRSKVMRSLLTRLVVRVQSVSLDPTTRRRGEVVGLCSVAGYA